MINPKYLNLNRQSSNISLDEKNVAKVHNLAAVPINLIKDTKNMIPVRGLTIFDKQL